MATVREVAKILTERVPQADTWSIGETYGGQGTDLDTEVKKVLYCVTAQDSMVPYCKENGYDILVSHHPMVVKGIPQVVLHTALDCCKGGLNDQWMEFLGVQNPQHFDRNLGWYGAITPILFSELVRRCEQFIGSKASGELWAENGDDTVISSVVICTGLGGMVDTQAAKTGADCYILGESVRKANLMKFKAVIEIGHTKSEKMGIKVIQEMLEPHGIKVDPAPDNLDWYGYKEDPDRDKWKQKQPVSYEYPGATPKIQRGYWEEGSYLQPNRKFRGKPYKKQWGRKDYDYDWVYDETKDAFVKKNAPPAPPAAPVNDLDWDNMTEEQWQKYKEDHDLVNVREPKSWFSTPEAQKPEPAPAPKEEFSVEDWEKILEEQRRKRGEDIYKAWDEAKKKMMADKGTDTKASIGGPIQIVGGMSMTRAEVLGQFQIDEAGNITTPGLFTGQPVYVPYFYDLMMAGEGEALYYPNGLVVVLNVQPEDVKEFPELGNAKQVALEELDEGRIDSTTEPGVIEDLRNEEKEYWDAPEKVVGEPQGGAIRSQGAEAVSAEPINVGDKVEFAVNWLGADSYSQGEVAEIGDGIATVYITGDPMLIEHVPVEKLSRITDYAPSMFSAPEDVIDEERDVAMRQDADMDRADLAFNGSKLKNLVVKAMSYTDVKGQLRASFLLGQAQAKIWREAAEAVNKECGKEIKARVEKLWKWGTACLPEDAIRDVIQKVLQEKDIYPYPQLVGHIYAKLPKKWSADPYQTRAIGPDEQATGGSEPR